jgi:hypothetical protein
MTNKNTSPSPLDELIARNRARKETLQPNLDKAILPLADWLTRDLPPVDPLLGHWLTTTSRAMLFASTGLGKSMLAIALGMRIGAGFDFLRWAGRRPRNVLFVDGETSNRLLKERLIEEAKRLGVVPAGFHALSHEDVENFAPLNTPEGQNMIEAAIAKVGAEFTIFDNVMSLLSGNMKETEQWAATIPWVRALTAKKIGQLWVHHANEDNKAYGDKTREWQMDTVLFGEKVERPDADVSMKLTFRKARERTPATRADFADLTVALVDDVWTYSSPEGGNKRSPSPLGRKFLDALGNALAGDDATTSGGIRRAPIEAWRRECSAIGLLDKDKEDSARALFSKHRRELIAWNQIACSETLAWVV